LGHDGLWFLGARAREYKTKRGRSHNAWFYYVQSWDLMAPVTFMDTKLLSKITPGIETISRPQRHSCRRKRGQLFRETGRSYSLTDISVFSHGQGP